MPLLSYNQHRNGERKPEARAVSRADTKATEASMAGEEGEEEEKPKVNVAESRAKEIGRAHV